MRSSHLPGQMSLWSCSHVKWRDKVNMLYLHFHKTYKHLNGTHWWLRLRFSHLPSNMFLWLWSYVKSSDKIKTFNFHFHKTYKRQSWYCGDWGSWIKWTCDVKIKTFISIKHQRPKSIKLGKVRVRFFPILSHIAFDHLVTDVTRQIKNFLSPLPQDISSPNLAE